MDFIGKLKRLCRWRSRASRFLCQQPQLRGYEIGRWSYGWPKIICDGCGTTLRIGNYCSIAKGVIIALGGEHHTDTLTTYPFSQTFPELAGDVDPALEMTRGDVIIGNDVWICRDAFIRSGVTIGDGAIIGAGAVVTRNVEPYAVVVGNPARVARYRFPEEQRKRMLTIAWWNWPLEVIKKAWPVLDAGDVEALERFARENNLSGN